MRYVRGCLLLHVIIMIQAEPVKILVLKEYDMTNWPSLDNSLIEEREIIIDREDTNSTRINMCDILVEGVWAVVDLTWSGFEELKSICEMAGVGYLKIENGLTPYLRAVDNVLTEIRKAIEVSFIFESESGKDWQGKRFKKFSKYLLSLLWLLLIFLSPVEEKEEKFNQRGLPESLLFLLTSIENEIDQILNYLILESNLRVALFSGLNMTTASQMKNMRPTPPFNIIVGDTKFIKSSLEKAVKFQLIRRDNTWLLVITDFKYGEIERDLYKKDIDVLSWNTTVCCSGSENNCECPLEMDFSDEFIGQVKAALETAVSKSLSQGVPGSAISIDCDATVDSINKTSVFSNQLQEAAHEHWALYYDIENSILTPNLYMNFRTESQKGSLHLGSWSKSAGLIKEKHIKPVKRFFRIGTGYSIPFAYPMLNDKNEKVIGPDGKEVWEGYCIDLIERLAENMNIDFELVTSYDFGEKRMDGSWTGLIGELQKGQIDIIIGALIMTSEKEEVIDFVAPYFEQTGFSIVIRKPLRTTSLFKFMTVLRIEVWFSILGALCLTAVMIWFLDKYSPYSARNNKEKYPYPCRVFSLRESFWFAITSFTPQGGGEAPKALSARTLVAAYWLFVVLMLATFTANLAAFLTVERMQSPVQSLKQLSKQSRINYTVVTDSHAHAYFRNMKHAEETLYNVWKDITLNRSVDQSKYRVWDYPIKEQYGRILIAIEKTGTVATVEEGFNKVKENEDAEFALIHDALQIKYEVYSNCNLTEIGEPFAEQPYAIAVQQGSHLNEEISRRILDLQRDRFFEALSAKYWNTTKKGKCDSFDEDEGITLESLGGVFIATLFGLLLAMITLAAEVYYQKRKTKSKIADKGEFTKTLFHDENFSKKEFTNTFKKRSNLVNSKPKVNFITVYPRDQLF